MGDRVRHGEMQQQQRQGQREDAGARSKVRQHREVVQPPSFAANNRPRPAELTAQGPPQLQLRPIEGARGPWGWPRAPRGLCLRRRENGFGFTLRHFIVYPPESYTILQGDRRLWGGVLAPGSGLKSIDEPMDTIFVKNVKENSPAHAAGLATGDRIISVNGETIGGKTYAEVVQLIQQSTKFLHLLVVPKEDDILQLYFADTAHNPETNQRPALPSSMRSPEAMLRSSAHRQQQHHQQFSLLPKPRPYRPTAGEATAQAPSSPRCSSGGVAAAVAPSSLPDGAAFQQNPSQQPHSWHLVARAHPVVTRRSSDTNLRIREADVYCDPYQVEETEDHRRTSGGSGWSSESGGVRSSLPVGAFSPRPLHSPPSYCSVDGSEGTLGHDSNGSLHSLPTSYGSPFCSLDPRRRDSTVSLPPTMRCDGFRDGGPPASPGGSGACYPEDEDDSAVTDSVMRRIRKSFEQKEEFLRRPTQPIWLPQTSAAIPREFYAHPQKFQRPPWPPNQQNGGEADESPSSPSKQMGGPPSPAVAVSRKGGAECVEGGGGGGGSQHGRQRHSTKSFVTTLSRITENLPAQAGSVSGAASATPPQSPPPALQLVSRRARQFESGEVAEEGETVVDKTNFYRSELSRLSSKRSVPNVAVRKREFECRGKESRSFDGPGVPGDGIESNSDSHYASHDAPPPHPSGEPRIISFPPAAIIFIRPQSGKLGGKHDLSDNPNPLRRRRHHPSHTPPAPTGIQHAGTANSSGGGGGGTAGDSPCPPSPAPRTPSPKPTLLPAAFSGNRLTPVGGSWLHCEPPPDFFEQQTPTPEELPAVPSPSDQRRRSRSNSADDSWAAGATSAWVQKHHAQPSIQQSQQVQQQAPHQQTPSHQQPQSHQQQQQTPQQHQHPPEAWRSSQGDSSTVSVDTSPNAGRRLVRQHSYLAAVKKPIHAGHFAMQEDGDSDSDECWGSMGRERGSEEASEPKRRSQALRPTHLDIPHPIRPASLQAPPSPDEDVGGDSSTTAGTPTSFPAAPAAPASTPEEGATTFPPGGGAPHYLVAPPQELEAAPGGPPPYGNRPSPTLQTAPARSSPAVIRRQKTASQIEDEAERVVRRVSYLKATWGDRMHVDSDLELSDSEQAASGHLRPHDLDQSSRSSSVGTLPLRPFCQNPSMPLPSPPLWGHTRRLKSLFEERMAAFSSGNKSPLLRTPRPAVSGSSTSDAVMVSGIPQPTSAVSASAARQSHGILRLRSLFTDRQHHHQDAAASNTVIPNLHSGNNKENQHVAKEGWLQCKFTVVEGKRSADRSWKQVRAILRGSYLHLVKDRKESSAAQQQTPGMMLGQSSSSATGSVATLTSSSGTAGTTTSSSSSSSSSEEVVDVRHGVVDVAGDYTKRKHVFRLSAGPGGPGTHSSELLLQAEDSIDMLQWIRALQESGCRPEAPTPLVSTEKENSAEVTPNGSSMAQGAVGTTQGIPSSQPIGPNSACAGSSAAASAYVNRLSPLPAHKGIRKLTSFRNRSPTGQSPVNKTRKASQGDQLPSPKSKTWKGRVAKQFRRIQQGGGASSPSSPTAPRPEGVTIGIPLEDCPQSTFCEFVPLLVELCTSIVEARGLDIIGIYRVPGNTAAVASLTEGVNRGFDCINMQDARWNDVNVISSLLKLFFRRLPDSLLTSELYPLFIESDKIEGPERRIATIRKLVHELPDHHFETLKYLLYHLKKVVSHCHVNKMEARNLAIVFGPTLVRTADDNMVTMVTDMSHQCRIVETLISHVDWFFSDEDTDDLSSIPFDVYAEAGESGDASGANQNLLLNNIQKVEGMKADSPSKEISAKDIVSSIISAANRKMQKAKGRKGGGGGGGGGGVGGQEDFGECISEHRDNDKQGCDKQRSKEEGGQQSRGQGEMREGLEGAEGGRHGSTSEEQRQQRVSVASSILGSVIFSGNIVKSIHESEASHHNNSEDHGEVISPTNNEEEISPPSQLDHRGPPFSVGQPVDLGGTIRTYAGLSATTQERIRRFEMETRAMLQRDAAKQRSSDGDQLGLQISADRGPENSPHNKEARDSAPVFIKPMAHASDDSSSPEVSRALLSAPIQSSSSRPRLHSHPTHHQRNSSPSMRQSGLCPPPPLDPPASVGIQSPLGDSGNILHPVSEKLNFLEEGAPLSNLRRGNSAENLARQTGNQGQRGLVSEQLDFNTHKIASNGTLKRLKTECEQPQVGGEIGAIRLPPTPTAVRRGSLDSLQEAYGQEGRDRPSSDVSDDGSDLLASLTSTFDKKLRSLLGPGASHSSGEHHSAQGSPREAHPEEAEESMPGNSKTTPLNSSLEESNHRLPERTGATAQQEPEKWSTRKEKEAVVDGGEEKAARGGDRRSKSSTVESTSTDVVDAKPRRSDSLSKTEKTEANTKTKDGERQWRRREAGVKRGGDDEAKLKRKNGMPDRSIKRRHTVGGTKDFDKIEWAVGNGRDGDKVNAATVPDEKDRGVVDCEEVGLRAWLGRERLRTSSPDLGCRRAIGGGLVVEINVLLPGAVVGRCGVVRADSGPGGVGTRPHGLPTTRVHEQPLESHV